MNNHWHLLDWDYVCDQSPGVRAKYDRTYKFEISFCEFIETTEGLAPLVSDWWNSLDKERQKNLLREKLTEITQLRNNLVDALEELGTEE